MKHLITLISAAAPVAGFAKAWECSVSGIQYDWHECGSSPKSAERSARALCRNSEPKATCALENCWQVKYACPDSTPAKPPPFTYCDFHPTAPACESGGYYCRAHPTDPACSGGPDACESNPLNPSCRP